MGVALGQQENVQLHLVPEQRGCQLARQLVFAKSKFARSIFQVMSLWRREKSFGPSASYEDLPEATGGLNVTTARLLENNNGTA